MLTLNHLAVMRFETNLAVERRERAPVRRGLSGHVPALRVPPGVLAITRGPSAVREVVNPGNITLQLVD